MPSFDTLFEHTSSAVFPSLRWDIFCRVIDNFGDAGVCWRLAKTLVHEHGQTVRVWIDEPAVLAPLCGGGTVEQAGVEVLVWTPGAAPHCEADVVIEAFACELPEIYLASMAMKPLPPCWINLEYLSAEAWVEGCHGLASPHPALSLKKHFFFPGFTEKTGGLLWGARPPKQTDFLQTTLGLAPDFDGLTISFFAYDHIPADGLLAAWRNGVTPVRCLVPPGKPRSLIEQSLGEVFDGDAPLRQGKLTLVPIPFVSQEEYDQLLLSCDVNFVRGEDSFVRAQWAGKPFVWQIYPQDEFAHVDKLEAFLGRFLDTLGQAWPDCVDAAAANALRRLHAGWNGFGSVAIQDQALAWADVLEALPAIRRHAEWWAGQYQAKPDLLHQLVKFVGKFRCLSV